MTGTRGPDPLHQLHGRIGAYTAHSRHDPRESTSAAREAFLKRFLDQVDLDRVLPEPERQRRAAAARQAYMARLAYVAAKARAARKQPAPARKTRLTASSGAPAGGDNAS
jgi:hypothetical protein